MKKKVSIFFTALVITVCVNAQTVITPKGTKTTVDTSKWTLSGSNIYSKNSGNVGIGTIAPASKLQVSNGDFLLENENNWNSYKGITYSNTQYPQLFLGKARGTKASPSYPQATNTLGVFKVANAIDLNGGAGFRVSASETQTATAHGSSLTVFTTPNGSSSNVDVFMIDQDGKVGIGTSTPAWMLDIKGGSNASALIKRVSGASAVTAPGLLFVRARGSIGAESNIANGDLLGKVVFGGRIAGADTDYSSFMYMADGTTAGTGHYGFTKSDMTTEIMSIRTDNNRVGVGTASPSQKFEVRGTDAQPTGMNALITNATLRMAGSTNHALDFGTFTNSPWGCYIESQNLTAASTLPLVLNPSGGRVGIGVIAPDAPLHVNGTSVSTPALNRTYFIYQSILPGLTSNNATATASIQVHANGWYWADGGGFVATSDARIKNINGLTNTTKDLETLKRIQVTDYSYIDKIAHSAMPQKKVIAQQLRDVYPIAVNTNTGIIPNVFETAVSSKVTGSSTRINTAKAHGFTTGDMVKLIIEETGEKTLEVTVLDNRSFSVAEPIAGRIFVYGKKVNDLLSVDYDAVAMLNVAATQELAKQLETAQNKIEQLQAENRKIAATNDELKKMFDKMQFQLNEISKKVAR